MKAIVKKIHYESTTADNIKDAHHRHKVKRALKGLQTELKSLTKQKNGYALFAHEEKCTVIIPPFLSKLSLYRCDKTFYLHPLHTMSGSWEKAGLIVVSGEGAKFFHCRINPAKLLGDHSLLALLDQILIDTHSSFIRSKHGRGGFSQNRFERLRENDVDHYTKDVFNLHERHNQECSFTLFYGSKDKIERLKNQSCKHANLTFLVGSATDKKAQTHALLEVSTRYFQNEERQALALLNQYLVDQKGESLVYGERECELALEQNLVQTIWRNQKVKDCAQISKEYVVYGFTPQGVQFEKQFKIVGLLYRGCQLLP